jgi:outer membrane receptor protein involved in Fe transport
LAELDRLRGFTVGPIIQVDRGAANTGSSVLDALDIDLDWRWPLAGDGNIRVYGAATWQPRLKQRRRPDQPWVERIGYVDGPLAWRGHAGAEWTYGPLLVDLNVQFLDSYRVTYGDPLLSSRNLQILRYQGRKHVPSQTYLDLTVTRRIEFATGSVRALDLRLSVQNLLDRRVPTITDPSDYSYSTYGDPRGRRFGLTVSSEF